MNRPVKTAVLLGFIASSYRSAGQPWRSRARAECSETRSCFRYSELPPFSVDREKQVDE
jgi:hypothetical protein